MDIITRANELLSVMYDVLNGAVFGGELDKIEVCAKWYTFDADGNRSYFAGAIQRPNHWYGGNRYGIVIDLDECGTMASDKARHEADSVADFESYIVEVLAETLIHEMVHYWCATNGIVDVVGDGVHTEGFRDATLAHGQDCEERDGTGWSATGISLMGWIEIQAWCDDNGVDFEEVFGDDALEA